MNTAMNTASTLHWLDQSSAEHIVLPSSQSMADDVQVIEHDIEEITLSVPCWKADVITDHSLEERSRR